MDRRATRTDPLLRAESYTYDLNGNVSTITDRKGQVTAFTYDGLNRPISVCFNQIINAGVTSCESTATYQYDLVNRQTIITDSLGGTITETFDDLGRLVSESNPQGSISYAYDPAGRLTTKTIAGQTPFVYAYDDNSHLLSITQGTQSVQFTYDPGGRPATVTLPNGVVGTYGYDGGSRLTSISYSLNQVLLGNLTYSYDALNRRIGVDGTLAATGLPQSLTSATYDAANQIATWNGATFTYDPNGNLANDGQNTYTWNARGQLAGIAGTVNASFSYDALGRRLSRSVGANALDFVYDGSGVAQELTGGTVTASIWSGGSNGFIERTDSSGAVVPLTDAQGSVVALTDAEGNLLTQYYYDPFGGTSAAGSASGNAFQYIGRENDPSGLYYMHARYYSPAVGRFISEDPLGFAGADVNLHAYTFGSPTNLRDPNGTNPLVAACAFGAATDVALNLFADYYTGRKTRWQDAFSSATLRYAGEGCVSGLGGAMFSELVLAPIIDMAAPLVAKVFTSEVAAAVDDGVSAACDMCFPAGTPVWTRKGKVPIEKIKVGDEVLSRNMQTGKLEYKRVISLVRPHQDRLMELHIAGEPAPLRPTPSHPLFVKRAGELDGEWIKAADLKIGDRVLNRQGKWSSITHIGSLRKQETVYNFEVEAYHDYFVGSPGVLVHNTGPCDIATRAAQGFENGQCVNCAEAIERALAEAGESGTRISINTGDPINNGNIFSDIAGQNISTNGIHEAVDVEGTVFDNITPNGIPKPDWLNSLHTILGNITDFIK